MTHFSTKSIFLIDSGSDRLKVGIFNPLNPETNSPLSIFNGGAKRKTQTNWKIVDELFPRPPEKNEMADST